MHSLFRGIALLFGGLCLLPSYSHAEDCQVSVSQPVVDFGRFNRTTLKAQAQQLMLGTRNLGLTVSCPRPQDLTLFFRAPMLDGTRFGLGDQGSYSLRLEQAQLDGLPVELGRLKAPGQAPVASGPVLDWLPQTPLAPLRDGRLAQGRLFSARLEVQGRADAAVLGKGDALLWQGGGVIEAAGASRPLELQAAFAPVACTPQLGNGGLVDFGRIPARQLGQDAGRSWHRAVSLNVRCDAPTRFAISARDNRPASVRAFPGLVNGALLFGVGNTRAGQALGGYAVSIDSGAQGDGVSLAVLQAQANARAWQAPSGPAYLAPDRRLLGFAKAAGSDRDPSAISHLSGLLNIDLFLAPAGALTLDEEAPIDGAATLEIIYL
ncbi:DUF1120 domain-containing protein [Pseudomonas sp. EMN2]|uniref:DUF1120 domain-containing protein n=1 Tax=Pseudomonas sp. EMN2 TaxID=2615212 RepID=UPI00129A8E0D|nr:DUF1120 domain-containing protein [Pseudomonas sp. EMN2]